jgi:hypothetical protein
MSGGIGMSGSRSRIQKTPSPIFQRNDCDTKTQRHKGQSNEESITVYDHGVDENQQ